MIQNSRLRVLPNGCYPSKCCVWCNQHCVVPEIIHFYQTIRNPFCFQWLGFIELQMIICWNTSLQPAIHLVLSWSRGWPYPLQPNASHFVGSPSIHAMFQLCRCAPWDLCRWVPGEAWIPRCHGYVSYLFVDQTWILALHYPYQVCWTKKQILGYSLELRWRHRAWPQSLAWPPGTQLPSWPSLGESCWVCTRPGTRSDCGTGNWFHHIANKMEELLGHHWNLSWERNIYVTFQWEIAAFGVSCQSSGVYSISLCLIRDDCDVTHGWRFFQNILKCWTCTRVSALFLARTS